MATIAELVADGKLIRFDPQLDDGDQELRLLYMLPKFNNWLTVELPGLGSTWNIEESPAEQLDALLADYASGLALQFGTQFKWLRPVEKGIWELKTADIRVFGWFPKRDVFIAASADTAERLKTMTGLYRGYIDEAVRFRENLPLDEPKFIPGDDPHAVLSNCARTL